MLRDFRFSSTKRAAEGSSNTVCAAGHCSINSYKNKLTDSLDRPMLFAAKSGHKSNARVFCQAEWSGW